MSDCTSRNGDIHFCKLEQGHSGEHFCSHMCDDWESEREPPLLDEAYYLKIELRTPDGMLHEQSAIALRSEEVEFSVQRTAKEFAYYLRHQLGH